MKPFVTMFLTIFLCVPLFAQKDTVVVGGIYHGGGEGSLNTAVQEKIDAGTLSNTVFKLYLADRYVLTGWITVPAGETLEIVAPPPGTTQMTVSPQIAWKVGLPTETVTYMFNVFGNLTMRNIWVRFADVEGNQIGSPIAFQEDPLATAQVGDFEGCIIDYMQCGSIAGGAISVLCKHFNGIFRNCYFRNCVDRHFMYYGRALSFPFDTVDWHNDYVLFENCTFANIGYVYMQESNEYGDNVHFNHCTFYNVVMYSLEGGVYWKMSVTNSLFVNAYMLGNIPVNGIGGAIFGITPTDEIDFAVNWDNDQDRRILFAHNAYYIDDWLVKWMRGSWVLPYKDDPDTVKQWQPESIINDYACDFSKDKYRNRLFDEIPYPRPMFDGDTEVFFDSTYDDGTGNMVKAYPYINRTTNYDKINPGFVTPPLDETNLPALKWFLNEKWGTNLDTNWAYLPESGKNQLWPLPEDMSYTNDTLLTAAMGGFPLGDLYHWFPTEYAAWEAQADSERADLDFWVEYGHHPDSSSSISIRPQTGTALPEQYALKQNYPNPFNPVTKIEYSVPAWGRVRLEVFNMLGQRAALIYSGWQEPGNYVATLDGSNLPSGIYFYRLLTEKTTITKKMVLLK